MKHFRFILASLFVMLSLAAHAQQVVITKTNGTTEVFQPNEVDSVVYKPAPKYYYYAGWVCPTNEEELASLAVGLNGEEIKDLETMAVGTQIRLFDGELTHARGDWFIVIPANVGIYGPDGANSVEDTFAEPDITSITNYKIFTKRGSTIAGYMI